MPNILAQIVLYSWPLVTWLLFRKLSLTQALAATILLGYLFIPERVGYDPPMLPPIDKHTMPSLCAAIAIWLTRRNEDRLRQRAARRAGEDFPKQAPPAAARKTRIRHLQQVIIAVLLLCAPVIIWLTNREPVIGGLTYIPGLQLYDIISITMLTAVMLLPFWLARDLLGTREGQLDLLRVIALCGLAYSFLVIWEARMSPQINRQLYGFFAHDWFQHIRDGYRPIIFLAHGLRVGIFLAMALVAAAVLARVNADGKRGRWLILVGWLAICLVVSRNTGATSIAILITPIILLAPTRVQVIVAAMISVVVLLYPLARGAGLIPADRIVTYFEGISADRASSLAFRLTMEDLLLERANQKPLAGWGSWGRNLIPNPNGGRSETIPDGFWIMIIGSQGWIGYLTQFGLLCLPGILAMLRYRRFGYTPLDAGLLLLLSANLIDLIPNSSAVPVLWLIAGMAWGRLEQADVSGAQKRQERQKVMRRTSAPQRLGTGVTPSKT